jgi:hypothetical protein
VRGSFSLPDAVLAPGNAQSEGFHSGAIFSAAPRSVMRNPRGAMGQTALRAFRSRSGAETLGVNGMMRSPSTLSRMRSKPRWKSTFASTEDLGHPLTFTSTDPRGRNALWAAGLSEIVREAIAANREKLLAAAGR